MRSKLNGWMVALLLGSVAAYAIAEEITLTTYYPSPRGVYDQLRTAGNVQIGRIDPPAVAAEAPRLHVVRRNADTDPADTGFPALLVEDEIPNAGLPDPTPFVIDENGNVGIGTTGDPATGLSAKLEVAGNISVSGSGNGLVFPDGSSQTSASRVVQSVTVTDSVRHDTTTGRTGDRGVPALSINKRFSSSKIIVQWSLTMGVWNQNVQIMWRTGGASGPIVNVTGVGGRWEQEVNVRDTCFTTSGFFVDATTATGPLSYYLTYGRGAGLDEALQMLINCNGISESPSYQQSSSSFLLMEVLE